ncbi:MAG TPA: CHASE domain-containing protein [Pyrinomonadaceae bacterium]|nr:CHASE domain-containing protein [Pyrinomonadaceae bacterium]
MKRARDVYNQRSRRHRVLVPYLILVVGLAFTLVVYYHFSRLTLEQDQSRFQKNVQELQDRIRLKLETSITLLRAGTGLFAASDEVAAVEFHRFVQQLDLQKNYPGIQGIGFSRSFTSAQKDELVQRMRQAVREDFHVWPDGPRDQYTAIIYLYPPGNRNENAIGYDMFDDPVRRQAMEQARDTGAPAASGRVQLVQGENKEQPAFLIYAPVYRNSAPLNSIDERRRAILGYVYSPYFIDEFLGPITSEKNYDVSFRVYDGSDVNEQSFLYGTHDAASPSDHRFTEKGSLDVAGRPWTLRYAEKPSFERGSSRPLLKYTLIVGALLSFLFFAITRAEVRARSRAEQSAEEVRESEKAINEANERALSEYERLLERISSLSQALGTARELNTIFHGLREFTRVSVPCDGFFVSLYDPLRDVRTACYGWGDGEEVDVSQLPPMPVTESGPNSRAVRTGQVVITNDYMRATSANLSVIVGEDNGLRPESSLALPMAVMGRIIGTIEVQSYQKQAYRHEHVTAMTMAANLTAVAIENIRLLKLERTAREAAEESNRLKDEFLATVSHELRTPLTAILGWARLLEDGSLDGPLAQQAIETIWRNARAQAQIVDDILDVSRIITGNLYIDLHPIEVVPVVQNAINVVRPTADAKGIRIETDIDNTPPAMISGDANRLQQVIWNLLSNAVKFTNSGGRVALKVTQANAAVEISVTDTGQGISREFMPYVFDRFSQADSTTTRHHGGLGLGLAIARHLVEIHGGTIRAASRGEGQGATFTITLPLLDSTVKTIEPATDKSIAYASQMLSGVNVLLVDDDSDTLKLMATALTRRQANVTAVSSAGEAIQAIRQKRPDVLVSDIAMPGEDGYGLIEKVRSLDKDETQSIPAVAITAYAKEEDRERALSSGFQIYLAKPIELRELVSVVARAARRDF